MTDEFNELNQSQRDCTTEAVELISEAVATYKHNKSCFFSGALKVQTECRAVSMLLHTVFDGGVVSSEGVAYRLVRIVTPTLGPLCEAIENFNNELDSIREGFKTTHRDIATLSVKLDADAEKCQGGKLDRLIRISKTVAKITALMYFSGVLFCAVGMAAGLSGAALDAAITLGFVAGAAKWNSDFRIDDLIDRLQHLLKEARAKIAELDKMMKMVMIENSKVGGTAKAAVALFGINDPSLADNLLKVCRELMEQCDRYIKFPLEEI